MLTEALRPLGCLGAGCGAAGEALDGVQAGGGAILRRAVVTAPATQHACRLMLVGCSKGLLAIVDRAWRGYEGMVSRNNLDHVVSDNQRYRLNGEIKRRSVDVDIADTSCSVMNWMKQIRAQQSGK